MILDCISPSVSRILGRILGKEFNNDVAMDQLMHFQPVVMTNRAIEFRK